MPLVALLLGAAVLAATHEPIIIGPELVQATRKQGYGWQRGEGDSYYDCLHDRRTLLLAVSILAAVQVCCTVKFAGD